MDASRGKLLTCLSVLALSLAAGCDRGGDGPLLPDAGDVGGAWEQVGGPLLRIPEFTNWGSRYALFLRLDESSRGGIHLRTLQSGLIHCTPLIYGIPAPGSLILYQGRTFVFTTSRPRSGILALTDADGHEFVFALRPAVPDSMLCRELTVLQRIELAVEIERYSALACDGTWLWFTRAEGLSSELVAVDPDAGAIVASRPIAFVTAPLVQASQDGDLWRKANFEPTAWRVAPDETPVDEVSSLELGMPALVRSIAHDPSTGSLWIGGPLFGREKLLEVDAGVEPDRLLRAIDIDFEVHAMTWNGSRLLALTYAGAGTLIVTVIDATAFRIARTYADTDPDLALAGIAATGERVFLLGQWRVSGKAVILEVRL